MTTETAASSGYRRATMLMTATSVLVPLGGLVTAPVLAQALGVDGRGEVAAALAPATLVLGIATLGLPEALVYLVARRPSIARRAIAWSALVSTGVGLLSVAAVWWALPFLSAGDEDLAALIMTASVWNVPALVVGVLRGAATGRQMWGVIAWERIALTVARIGVLFGLFAVDLLTVKVAVLVSIALPILSGLVYLPVLRRPPQGHDVADDGAPDPRVFIPMMRYGTAIWHGGIATMAIARLPALLMLPLSGSQALGLYSVATQIADAPLIVAMAIQNTLFGVSSRAGDPGRVTLTSRLTLLFGVAGCLAMGLTLPWWIGPLFGEEFTAAIAPTLLLLGSAIILIPGLMATSGLAAWGRPGLRSASQVASLVVHLGAFLVLVPSHGAVGAGWAAIAGTVTMTAVAVVTASRVMDVRARDFLLPGGSDVARAWAEGRGLAARLMPRGRGRAKTTAPDDTPSP
ncbi:lipopolysaccharide biosynthesis protein [Demequina sp.]|uniref:lipopolysaccharide biosynthesis protein n=1 Tax=Demequina sp. TaxID=2050685 RepID=UPI003A8665CC